MSVTPNPGIRVSTPGALLTVLVVLLYTNLQGIRQKGTRARPVRTRVGLRRR